MHEGLTRALRLDDSERAHLHLLAGVEPQRPVGPPRAVRQSILDLLYRLPQAAATVLSATHEVLACNDLACALMEDFSALPRRDRNLVRRVFLGPKGPGGRRLDGVSDIDEFARTSARQLRAAAARYPDDPEVAGLVEEPLSGSEESGCCGSRSTSPRSAGGDLYRAAGITVGGDAAAAVGAGDSAEGCARLTVERMFDILPGWGGTTGRRHGPRWSGC